MPDQDVKLQEEVNGEPQVTPVELEAREQGWVPKEDFEGDDHKWVDAGEFLRRGELFKKIESQNKELKEFKKTLQLFKQHNDKVKETEYKRALETLKAQKKEALVEGDPDKLIEIDEKIDLVKDQQKEFETNSIQEIRAEAATIHPDFQAWMNRNTWYTSDEAMKAYADATGRALAAGGKTPTEVLKEVEAKVKANFPSKFKNPNREKPGAVEGASTKGTPTKGSYQPSDLERQVAKRFVKAGAFKTEEEYYKQLQG